MIEARSRLFIGKSGELVGEAISILPLDCGAFYIVRCSSGQIKRIIDYSGCEYFLETGNV